VLDQLQLRPAVRRTHDRSPCPYGYHEQQPTYASSDEHGLPHPLCTRAAARVHLTTGRRPRQPDACCFTTESRRRCYRLRDHLDIQARPRSARAAHAHRYKSVHSAARSRPAETVLDCAIRGDIASPARTPRSWPNPRCRAAGWWSRPAYVDERPERSGVRGNEPAAQPPPSAATSETCSKQTPTCSISTHDPPRSCCALDGLS
jgi:hypothetical protein